MELHEIYLEIPTEEIAYVKFIFESYEGVGIVRTVLKDAPGVGPAESGTRDSEGKKAVIALLVVDDFLDVARAIVDSLHDEVSLREITPPEDVRDDWLLAQLRAEGSKG